MFGLGVYIVIKPKIASIFNGLSKHGGVRRHVRIRKLYDTARLRATVARDQTARVRSKQLISAIFGLWVEYA